MLIKGPRVNHGGFFYWLRDPTVLATSTIHYLHAMRALAIAGLIVTLQLIMGTVLGQIPDSAIFISIAEAESMPPTVDRDSTLAHSYNLIAEDRAGKNDSVAEVYLSKLQQLMEESRWKKAPGLYFRALGKYHDRRGDYQEALDAYTRSIEEFQRTNDASQYIAYAYIYKAFLLSNNGLFDEGFGYLEEIEPVAARLENKDCYAFILDAYGDRHFYPFFGQRDIPTALEFYKQVEEILPETTRPMIATDNAHCLAGCYMRLGQEELAQEYIDKAIRQSEVFGTPSVIFAVYGDLADFHEERGNYEEAIPFRIKSLEYAKKEHWIEMEARGEKNLAFTYKAAGDFENALSHFERWQALEDSISRYSVQERYAELQTKYESGKKDLEIEKLKAQNLALWRNILIIALLTGIGFLIYFRRLNKKLQRQNTELQLKNEQIQAALTEGRSLERKRMAIELHDNVNAKIAATKWMMESLENENNTPEENQLIQSIVNQITEVYEDVRFISHNLVPKEIEERTLTGLLDELVYNLNKNQRIHFELHASDQLPVLSNTQKLQVYSMIMELINNVLKHSESTRTDIRIDGDNKKLRFTVTDNGKGFTDETDSGGTGLRNVEARLIAMRGEMTVRNNQPSGANIEIEVPV